MKITRKDILTVFGVLMAFLVAATLHLSESSAIPIGMTSATSELAFQVKKTSQKFKILVQLKSLFSHSHHR
jgi:hypothetical protein